MLFCCNTASSHWEHRLQGWAAAPYPALIIHPWTPTLSIMPLFWVRPRTFVVWSSPSLSQLTSCHFTTVDLIIKVLTLLLKVSSCNICSRNSIHLKKKELSVTVTMSLLLSFPEIQFSYNSIKMGRHEKPSASLTDTEYVAFFPVIQP